MKNVLIFLSLTLSVASASGQTEKFKWLIGTWKLKNKEVYERWAMNETGGLTGRSFKINHGDTTILETLEITYRDGKYFYIPDVAGAQGAIEFAITTSDDRMFRAENPTHDFPKVIQYEYVRSEESVEIINAFIEGNGKRIPYLFERVR